VTGNEKSLFIVLTDSKSEAKGLPTKSIPHDKMSVRAQKNNYLHTNAIIVQITLYQ